MCLERIDSRHNGPLPRRRPAAADPGGLRILLALADGERHGYSILQEVEARSGGAVSLHAGTLYRALARLLESGLIEELSRVAGSDQRRRAPPLLRADAARHRRRPRRGRPARGPGRGRARPPAAEGCEGMTAPRRWWMRRGPVRAGPAGLSARLPPPLRRRDARDFRRRGTAGVRIAGRQRAGRALGRRRPLVVLSQRDAAPLRTFRETRHVLGLAARRRALRPAPGAAGAALHRAGGGRAGAGHRRQQRHLHRGAEHPAEAAALRATPASW